MKHQRKSKKTKREKSQYCEYYDSSPLPSDTLLKLTSVHPGGTNVNSAQSTIIFLPVIM